jgi:hypothetical protein
MLIDPNMPTQYATFFVKNTSVEVPLAISIMHSKRQAISIPPYAN